MIFVNSYFNVYSLALNLIYFPLFFRISTQKIGVFLMNVIFYAGISLSMKSAVTISKGITLYVAVLIYVLFFMHSCFLVKTGIRRMIVNLFLTFNYSFHVTFFVEFVLAKSYCSLFLIIRTYSYSKPVHFVSNKNIIFCQ